MFHQDWYEWKDHRISAFPHLYAVVLVYQYVVVLAYKNIDCTSTFPRHRVAVPSAYTTTRWKRSLGQARPVDGEKASARVPSAAQKLLEYLFYWKKYAADLKIK